MSAKQQILDAIGALPDETNWDELLAQVETLVARHRKSVDGEAVSDRSAAGAIARLTRRLHPATDAERLALEAELDAMAADPDIQRELRQIEAEFAGTDMDGMEGL
jgi:hypothetical protein